MTLDRLGDMRLFAEAASLLGSLSAAGRKLGLSPAAASARLFERTTRRLRLTDEGRLYLQHYRIALQAIDDAEAALQAGQNLVRGKVRISATSDFGRTMLCAWLNEFSALYLDVSFALMLSDSVSNMLFEEIGLAIRFGAPPDSGLAARMLAPNRRVLCARRNISEEERRHAHEAGRTCRTRFRRAPHIDGRGAQRTQLHARRGTLRVHHA